MNIEKLILFNCLVSQSAKKVKEKSLVRCTFYHWNEITHVHLKDIHEEMWTGTYTIFVFSSYQFAIEDQWNNQEIFMFLT